MFDLVLNTRLSMALDLGRLGQPKFQKIKCRYIQRHFSKVFQGRSKNVYQSTYLRC